jgi:hemerythrin
MELADVIPEFRERGVMSGEEVSQSIGVSEEVYNKYESGDTGIPIYMLYRMAACFGVTAEIELTGGVPRLQINITCHEGKVIEVKSKELVGEEERSRIKSGKGRKKEGEEQQGGEVRKRYQDEPGEPARKILDWQRIYSTGVSFFDNPNKNFIDEVNQLYTAILEGWDYARKPFEQALRRMVRYFNVNMRNEEVLMERVGYPEYKAHKQEHIIFLKEIHRQAKRYAEGQEIDVRSFVLYLKGWVQSHIGIRDRAFVLYLAKLKREGALEKIIVWVKETADNRMIIKAKG